MQKTDVFHWANRRPWLAFAILNAIGWLIHLAYEVLHPHPAVGATMVLIGAGIAGLAVDLLFTKGEEEAGEID